MYLSLNWLKDFVRFKQTPEQVAEVLTLGGFEVDKIEYKGKDLENIIVGQIKTIVSHAEADKLVVCKVDVGRKELLNIVCGARNIKPGHKVPVALAGIKLPNGLKIERRRIRGVDSEGMLCAEDELGLGEDHAGILILDKEARIGQKLNKVLGLDDIVLDISVSPNRADGFSIIGLAAEFAALSGQKFIDKKVTLKESKLDIRKQISVHVQDSDLCPKYTARVVKNVKVRPSPMWMQSRLRVCGVKPINNIVDITNYVMLERGQPLHAFDLAKIGGQKVVVRKAGQAMKFVTLDKEERHLSAKDLMIADSKEPIAIAGVMGGVNSEITKATKDVVIESAIFKPLSIRQTRQRLGIVTEASTRFEKGIWWDLPEWASDRAAQLISEISSGEVAKGIIIVPAHKEVKPTIIKTDLNYISSLIGRKFTINEVKQNLESLHFKVAANKDELKITIPSWRQDVKIPADIAEEVGRMYGWNNLKPAPIYAELNPKVLPQDMEWENKIKAILSSAGMTEVLNYSFYSQDLISLFGLEVKKHYRLENPLNPKQAFLRTTLIPRLYDNLMKNYQLRSEVCIFEIGNVFNKSKEIMPTEIKKLAGIIFIKSSKNGNYQAMYQIKNIVATITRLMPAGSVTYKTEEDGKINVLINKNQIGQISWLLPGAQKLGRPAAWFEFDLPSLINSINIKNNFQPVVEYPEVVHDLTFITPKGVNYSEVVEAVKKINSLIVSFEGTGQPFEHSEKELCTTYQIVFQAPDRTLTSQVVDSLRREVIQLLSDKFNMKLKK
ncbi:phenylalanine--tRNA ligase subunit beta [Patescibacteria group bacterium]|nr:phenylalanine--tRNA ligase subunit beta [Patescibacteria group bacterium]MBU0964078.1 phenylalanine--tRNA ligase subunit beta [Patescibacteria group bacterium]